MKAVICTAYGPPEVLKFKEVPKPMPKNDEVLVKIYATSAHIGDTRIRRVDPFLVRLVFGLCKPRKNLILGFELAGKVEAVGENVRLFKPGDPIFALTGWRLGGYAEYRCFPERAVGRVRRRHGLLVHMPHNLTFEEAATVPAGGLTALKNLHKANVKKGQKILINGASGSLGTYSIQLAKYFGAEVTAVCRTENFQLVRSIGADHTIDYTLEDFTMKGVQYDIVYDAVMKSSRSKCRRILKRHGTFVNNSRLPKIVNEDLELLKELIEKEHMKPIIDRTYSLQNIDEAHRYVDLGHKKGNVAITVVQ